MVDDGKAHVLEMQERSRGEDMFDGTIDGRLITCGSREYVLGYLSAVKSIQDQDCPWPAIAIKLAK